MTKCVYVLVIQLCPTLRDPMIHSSPGSSVYRILQARIVAIIPLSKGSFQLRNWTQVSYIVGRFFTVWATRVSKWRSNADKGRSNFWADASVLIIKS